MQLKINGVEIAAYPAPGGFKVKIMDLDDAETTLRTQDGTLHRSRIRVVRQIELDFAPLTSDQISSILKATEGQSFEFYYPDTMEGYVTKTFYVGNRQAAVPFEKNGVIWWDGLTITLTEY